MRWGGLAATVAVGLALGCSLRSLDDLSGGAVPPADGGPGPDAASADAAVAGGQTLFWVDSGDRGVHSAAIDGSGARRLITLPSPSYLRSIAVDAVHRKIYFSDSGLKKIQRANLDGTSAEDVVTGLDTPVGLDVDAAAGKLYFADQGARPTIFRANLDGSGKEAIVTAGIMHPYGLALDRAGRVYVVDNGLHAIVRVGLDGSGFEKLAVTGVTDPIELAIDPQGGKLYWSDIAMPPRIRRANLDGSGAEDVITQGRSPTLTNPLGVAVDVLARKLYWVDGGGGTLDVIQRAELDGSAIHPVVVGLSAPRGLTIAY
jgi:DNA-binding beta-propeller fold protein YncE